MALGMMVIGMTEVLLIILAVLILFGATKIPQLMRGMGQGIREFKAAVKDPEDQVEKDSSTTADEPDGKD